MKHSFYKKNKKEQLAIQLKIAGVALVFVLIIAYIAWFTGVYFFALLFVFILLSIIAPFFDTPSMKKSGKLIYYSPLFITEKEKDGIVKIHGGTLFDYMFVLKFKTNGKQRTKFILQQYLQGLLMLIEEFEQGKINNVKLRGTSYIINKRTIEKIGFKVIKTDFLQQFILIFNYFNLIISSSIAKAKISFPNLSRVVTFETELKNLRENKELIIQLNNQLERQLTN